MNSLTCLMAELGEVIGLTEVLVFEAFVEAFAERLGIPEIVGVVELSGLRGAVILAADLLGGEAPPALLALASRVIAEQEEPWRARGDEIWWDGIRTCLARARAREAARPRKSIEDVAP